MTIDPHVHLRDGEKQSHKETVKHGLEVAYKAGLDGLFDMPNTDPVLTSQGPIEERLEEGEKAIDKLGEEMFYGVYGGLTANPKQIEEIVMLHKKYFPKIVGLKMFAGNSTGNMGIIKESEQRLVYQTLADLCYKGLLAVHCEKESLMDSTLWNPKKPITHTRARLPEAETQSIWDQINFAYENSYEGTLHIAHVSVPESVSIIENYRDKVNFNLTCEVAPHHCVLYDRLMGKKNGSLLKMNPPLRPKYMQDEMLGLLLEGRIDYIATDHAPHALIEKITEPFASGIVGLPYYPIFIEFLRAIGMEKEMINNLTHNNIVKIFNLLPELIPNTRRAGKQSEKELEELAKEYDSDPYLFLKN